VALADDWTSAGATPFIVSFQPARVVMKVPYEFFLEKKLRHQEEMAPLWRRIPGLIIYPSNAAAPII